MPKAKPQYSRRYHYLLHWKRQLVDVVVLGSEQEFEFENWEPEMK